MLRPRQIRDVLLVTEPRFDMILDRRTFPNRLCMPHINWSTLDSMILTVKTWKRVFVTRPALLLFVSVTSVNRRFDLVSTFTFAKRLGFLNNVKIVFWSHKQYSKIPGRLVGPISESQGRYIDRIIISYRSIKSLHPALKGKFEFVPLPAHQIHGKLPINKTGDYVFLGGTAHRDFKTVFQSINDLDIPLKLRTLGEGAKRIGELNPPENCLIEVGDRLKDSAATYLERIANSRFVVVPLYETEDPRGLTTIIEAFCLGKPVITTNSPGLDDYVSHGVNSLRVKAGDVAAYRKSINLLWNDKDLLAKLSSGACKSAATLRSDYFTDAIQRVCVDVLESRTG